MKIMSSPMPIHINRLLLREASTIHLSARSPVMDIKLVVDHCEYPIMCASLIMLMQELSCCYLLIREQIWAYG